MRLVAFFALALAASAAVPVPAATVAIDAQRDGDAVDIHASAVLHTDAATTWRVLTDYGRYPQFIPDLYQSRVVARHGTTVIVEQSGNAALWRLRIPLTITYEIMETPPSKLQSRAVAGTLRALTSAYALTPEAAGTRLDYTGHVSPGFDVFGPLEQTAIEGTIARQFQALADEIERQGAAARAASTTTQPWSRPLD